jgi:hypothetical protein
LTDSNRRPSSRDARGTARTATTTSGRRREQSSSPAGTPRAGRRETQRRRYEQPTLLERMRTPFIVAGVVAVVAVVGAVVVSNATAADYSCTTVDTVQPAASGELGQVQPDMGNTHVNPGDKVTYPVCPPASGHHINRAGFGPLRPKVYGPDDNSIPNGWVHNLEHGGLVLLYSCDRGACDDATIQQLQAFSAGFPASPVCNLPPGVVGPVVARFEQMPTRFAALVWDRALYLDTLDIQTIYAFYTRYGERLSDDKSSFIAPPEPQCQPPSASPSPGASASPGASPSAGASASPSAPAPSPAASPASPASSAEPSPSAS